MAGALSGLRVLDLCIVLAGPTCGRTLAEYGADVIKVDNPARSPLLFQWIDVGRGKRSICLDLKEPRGLDAFLRLVETADVVLEGFRKGVAERMGIGYEQLRGRRPDIIYASINLFGQDGPWSLRPGYDQNAQAATGMLVRLGGRSGAPLHAPYTLNDYGTGLMAAHGVMLALLERSRTGRGQRVETSLSHAASTFSSPFLIDYAGIERREIIEGPEARGNDALSRLYETADGWIFLDATQADWDALTGLDLLRSLRQRPEFASAALRENNDRLLSDRLAAELKKRPADDWLDLIKGAGLSATRNASLREVLEDSYARDRGLIVYDEHPAYGPIRHGGVAPRLSRTPPTVGSVPTFGADTEAVLAEVGYSREEIESLRRSGIIPPAAGIPLS